MANSSNTVPLQALEPSLIEKVQRILPDIAGLASEAEQLRSVPPAGVALLRKIGFIRALVPARFGGGEVDFVEFLQALRLLSSACVSTGWFAGVVATHSHGISYYAEQAQAEIWSAGPDTIISSSFAPTGSARIVDGGYVVSGIWEFSSGSDHAEWVQLGFRVPNPDDPAKSETYLGLFPRRDCEIVDNWHTVGLKGTGSKRVVVADAFIPEYRCWGPGILQPSRAPGLHDHWLFRIPFIVTATNFVAVILGGADGAVAAYRDHLTSRKRAHTGQPRIDNPLAFVRLAESVLDIRAASALAESRWAAYVHQAKIGIAPAPDEQMQSRGDEAYAVRLAMRAVDRLMDASGGNAIRAERPIQRFWRDVHAAGGHAYFDLENKLIIVGRHLVGLEPDPFLF
ncbi:acyl-CoA dehydrogenase family protein [Sphingomonas sp. YL-JM2C]